MRSQCFGLVVNIDLTYSLFTSLPLGDVFVSLKIENKGGHLIYKWLVFYKSIVILGQPEHIFFLRNNVINDLF